MPMSEPINPFPGLRPFRTEEEYLFFGRDAQCADLIELLRQCRFIAVLGSSGTGKSSLVRAGLLPALYRGSLSEAGSHWSVAVCRPGGNPMKNLAKALCESDLWDHIEETTPLLDPLELETVLQRSGRGLCEIARMAKLPENENLLVVVDQFEELFRFRQDSAALERAEAFVTLLLEAAQDPERAVHVILTMRSDFFGDCAAFAGLSESVNRGAYLVPRLTRDQLKEIIEGPARVGGGKLAPRLVQRLLSDVSRDPDQLPVLQHALMRTWDRWKLETPRPENIDLAHYEGIGGMTEALSRHADEVFLALDPERQQMVGCLFKALTQKGADDRGVRTPKRLGQLCAILQSDEDSVKGVIDAFRMPGVTFLMPGPEVVLNSTHVIDISHESLMRVWKRLDQWVDEETQSARIYKRLSETASLWAEQKADLYHGQDLEMARAWRQESQPNPMWAEQYGGGFDQALQFLRKSEEKKDQEARTREENRQRELAQAKELARVKAISARRLWRFAFMLLGLVVLLAVAASVAYFAMRYAEDQAGKASTARVKAEGAMKSAQDAREQLSRIFSKSDYRLGQSTAEDGRFNESLAYLARALKNQPTQTAAADRIHSLLTKVSLPSLHFLHRDTRDLEAIAFTSDNSKFITASRDDHARVFDIASGKELVSWKHDDNIDSLATSPDGRFIASGSADHRVIIYDLETKTFPTKVFQHDGNVLTLVFSPDSQRLLTGTNHNAVNLWDVTTGARLYQMIHDGVVTHVRFNHSGDMAVSASDDNTARVWDLGRGAEVRKFHHDDDVASAFFDPSDTRVISASEDGTAKVWDLASGQLLLTLEHDAGIRKAVYSSDGRYVLTGSDDKSVRLWDAVTGTSLYRWLHQDAVDDVAFSPDGRLAASASDDMSVKLWDLETGREASGSPLMHRLDVDRLRFSPNGQWLGVIANNEARLWRFQDLQSPPLELAANHVTCGELSANGRWIVTGTAEGEIQVWDSLTGSPRHSVSMSLGSEAVQVIFSADGRFVAGGGADGGVGVWNAETGALVPGQFHHDQPVVSLDLDQNGRHLVVAHTSVLRFWDVTNQEINGEVTFGFPLTGVTLNAGGTKALATSSNGETLIVSIPEMTHVSVNHRSGTNAAAFSPDKQFVATASKDWTAQLWTLADQQPVGNPMDHGGEVLCLAFSRDGKQLVTGSRDRRTVLWTVPDAKVIGRPLPHGAVVQSVDFSPDGGRIVAGVADGKARVWDIDSLLPLTQPLNHPAPVTYVKFTLEGDRVVTIAQGDRARIWTVRLGHAGVPVPPMFWQLAEAVAGLRLNDQNLLEPIRMNERHRIMNRLERQSQPDGGAENAYRKFVHDFLQKHQAPAPNMRGPRGGGDPGPNGRQGRGAGRPGRGPRPAPQRQGPLEPGPFDRKGENDPIIDFPLPPVGAPAEPNPG